MTLIHYYRYHRIFFFELSGGHRDLHSFPTRRSSDLVRIAGDQIARGAIEQEATDLALDRDHQRARRGLGLDPDRSEHQVDRKSTRLNSSHVEISYAVFCLKKKKNEENNILIANTQTF